MISKILRLAIASGLALSLAVPCPHMPTGGDVIRRGNCSGSSDWKLKLSPEDGRIEVEYRGRLERRGPDLAGPDHEERQPDLQRLARDPRGERLLRGPPRDVQPRR